MKMLNFSLIVLSFLLASCTNKESQIAIKNESNVDLEFKQVVLTSDQVMKFQVGNGLPAVSDGDELIPTQLDDLDGDGEWDELAFQVSLQKGEEKNFSLKWVSLSDYPVFDRNTSVHLGYSPDRDNHFKSVDNHVRPNNHVAQSTPFLYQFEGVGWESNKVAFRSYFDSRNGKDIFGKRGGESIIDKIGLDENYHELQPWGMDVLKVGSSLGAGALAILKKDSLIRLGDTDHAEFKKVVEGPVRSVFQLIYKGWDVMGSDYEVTEEITIWAHKRWYHSRVKLKTMQSDTLVTGIVNLKGASVSSFSSQGSELLSTYGKQSENNDVLGMGIIVPRENYLGVNKAPVAGDGITNTELVMLKANNEAYNFFFYAGWEGENSSFKDEEYLKSQLLSTAMNLESDLSVSINNN